MKVNSFHYVLIIQLYKKYLWKKFYKKLKSKTLNDIASGKITYDRLDNILRADKEIVLEVYVMKVLFIMIYQKC